MPSLTPMYGLGSYVRTGASIHISAPRTRIGSMNRIYSYWKQRNLGQEFERYLALKVIGTQYMPKVNPWTYI
jgi:hypothetical protein